MSLESRRGFADDGNETAYLNPLIQYPQRDPGQEFEAM